ncbi:Tyrosine/DOPA decarboxylase 2 [Apostasia shenzhenica]|uniref:Tyrosine/DOPA decarboxylase 2 n=1 Tax=Apostasia shenzhenica TaxID=1088818 RepID=A0A2I0BE10_9ASPA|nr:Tyrosine/DOPA decarboxylase 2 [Apostasia shenzhenica]
MGSLNDEGVFDSLFAGRCLQKPLDPEEFRRHAHKVVDFIADYYKNIAEFPVRSQVEPGYLRRRLPDSAPHHPEPVDEILRDVADDILPGITHWMSPNYYAYFPSSGSTAAFLGEMLSTGFNVVGFNWISSPAATELESIVMDWLAKLLQLPPSFLFSGGGGGVLQGTTCEAILCTLTAARKRALDRHGHDQISRLVVYGSDQTHCAVQKASQIAGIHPANFRAIKTHHANAFALTGDSLRRAVEADVAAGLLPLFVCATIGTTSSTAVDRLQEIVGVAAEHGMWVHVDAAYAGSVCICPEFRHFINGVEGADSFSFNAHKWFFNNLDCCCLWVKEPAALAGALSTNPEYLKNRATESKLVVDYKDWQIALSRRFRSLKLWMVLRSYGADNLRQFLRGHVRMAKVFEGLLRLDRRFEVVVPRYFATVCFRLLPPRPRGVRKRHFDEEENEGILMGTNRMNQTFLEAMNAEGKLCMTHAIVGGVYVIRFAAGGTMTEERHVRAAWVVIKEHAERVLKEVNGAVNEVPRPAWVDGAAAVVAS